MFRQSIAMPAPAERIVTIKDVTYHPPHQKYDFTTVGGRLLSSYKPAIGLYTISDVDVEPAMKRQGIAKNLLARAYEHAIELGAPTLHSSIVSRECFDAMVSVFGREAVQLYHLGEYANSPHRGRYDTRAELELPLRAKS